MPVYFLPCRVCGEKQERRRFTARCICAKCEKARNSARECARQRRLYHGDPDYRRKQLARAAKRVRKMRTAPEWKARRTAYDKSSHARKQTLPALKRALARREGRENPPLYYGMTMDELRAEVARVAAAVRRPVGRPRKPAQ